MTLVAVATGLVSDAMSNTVSVVIGSFFGSTLRLPYAFSNTIPARRPMSTTQPAMLPSSIDALDGLVDAAFHRRIHAGRFPGDLLRRGWLVFAATAAAMRQQTIASRRSHRDEQMSLR